MKLNPYHIALGGAALLLLTGVGSTSVLSRAVDFIAGEEGFRSTPYWDVKQWSIGYGTRIGTDRNNKPAVTWTKEQARVKLTEIVSSDYSRLQAMVKDPLTTNQWVALLSFAYNVGVGNAKNITDRLNDGMSSQEVTEAMKLYILAGGAVSSVLVARRQREVNLYLS